MSSPLSRTDPAAAGLTLGVWKSCVLTLGLSGFTACPTTPCPSSWGALPAPAPCPGSSGCLPEPGAR